MSGQPSFETSLRAALHAAADSLEPGANGLGLIQARLRRPRSVAVLRATAAWNEIIMRAPAAVQDAYYWLDHGVRVVWDQLQRASTPGRHRSPNEDWVRPVILMISVMFIVAAGAYTAITASSLIFPSNSGAQSTSNGQTGHSGGGAPLASSSTHSAAPSKPKSSAAASCKPSAPTTPATATSPAASPAGSPSPSPTPTDTSTSTDPSPSPSDSGTSSPAPSDSVSSSPTPSVAPTTAAPAESPSPCAAS